MSSMRIVLVDPLGDVLFSGESWLAGGAAAAANYDGADSADTETESEPESDCPKTLRSGSGIFPVERPKPGSATGSDAADDDERDERAA